MSALLPLLPGQLERWRAPRPEPVSLELPGWTRVERGPDDTFPNQRVVTLSRGEAVVELLRFWDAPRSPGRPMVVASEREVAVAGRPAKLLRTSTFDGVAREVDVVWLRGQGHGVSYGVRLVLERCDDATRDEVLARVRVAW